MTMDADELKRGLEIAKGCAYDGRPLDSMTREELMAVAALAIAERDRHELARRISKRIALGCVENRG